MASISLLLLFLFCSSFCLSVVSGRPAGRAWSPLHASDTAFFNMSTENSGTSMSPPVQLRVEDEQIVVDNGIILLTLSKPGGAVIGIRYNGIENILYVSRNSNTGGYWNVVWNMFGPNRTIGHFDVLNAENYEVIVENENQVELSFKRTRNPSVEGTVPLNIDKRFVVLRGSSGFYTYAIFEHESTFPGIEIGVARVAFKLDQKMFRYMAMTDERQRILPLPEDRDPGRCRVLAYKEAVLITKPIDPESKGQVDDKYQYVIENEKNKVHGWISSNPPTGFWMIAPSSEFKTGGPLKQDLTSHVGPTTLAIFVSSHYAGNAQIPKFSTGEYWKKVFGPVFIYLNSNPDKQNAKSLLWDDAKLKMETEVQSWPYSFPAAEDFQKAHQRGTVTGTLMVEDRHISNRSIPASWAYIGLAAPGSPGSWQTESKGYQFWSRADANGNFNISNVIAGVYNLYAWVPNFIGDYLYRWNVTVTQGSTTVLPNLVYEPPRDGPTLWQIGVPDRTAAEFFIPDARPEYINELYINREKFRQYGLWDRYTDLYPERDLVYQVGVGDYRKDWFFAHVTRRVGSNSYQPTTWQIQFNLTNLNPRGSYTLRIALAAAHISILEVRVNDPTGMPQLETGLIGRENAIARHGVHGLYHLFNVAIPGYLLKGGSNTLYLTQTRGNMFSGVMYDYIRLEGPDVQ